KPDQPVRVRLPTFSAQRLVNKPDQRIPLRFIGEHARQVIPPGAEPVRTEMFLSVDQPERLPERLNFAEVDRVRAHSCTRSNAWRAIGKSVSPSLATVNAIGVRPAPSS